MLEDVQAALETMRTKADGSPVKPATASTYVAAVKSLLGFAHLVRYTHANEIAPLIKLKRAPRQVAQRIMGELEVRDLIKHANPGRDRLMLQIAHYGALRVSELVGLTWAQVIKRDSGEAQLSIVGKGDKGREVLIPTVIATLLLASCGEALPTDPVFPSVRNPGHPLTERAVNASSSRMRPSARASTRRFRSIGCGTPTRATPSTTGRRSPSCRPRSGMQICGRRASTPTRGPAKAQGDISRRSSPRGPFNCVIYRS
jgi:integrase/recombinase XerD